MNARDLILFDTTFNSNPNSKLFYKNLVQLKAPSLFNYYPLIYFSSNLAPLIIVKFDSTASQFDSTLKT